jgi:hypothetical protein
MKSSKRYMLKQPKHRIVMSVTGFPGQTAGNAPGMDAIGSLKIGLCALWHIHASQG